MLRYKTETRPGLVALYDIRPGNGAGQFLQPRSPHGANLPRKCNKSLKTPSEKLTSAFVKCVQNDCTDPELAVEVVSFVDADDVPVPTLTQNVYLDAVLLQFRLVGNVHLFQCCLYSDVLLLSLSKFAKIWNSCDEPM